MEREAPDATPRTVATFAARLDHLVATWEAAIAAPHAAPQATADVGRRTTGEVLAQLEATLDALEQHCREHRREAEAEARAAADWAERAEIAVRRDEDDLARHAIARHGEHAAAAEHAAAEAAALEGVRDMYRRALAVVRDVASPAAGEASRPGG